MKEKLPEIFARINEKLNRMQPLFGTGTCLPKESSVVKPVIGAGITSGHAMAMKLAFSHLMKAPPKEEATLKISGAAIATNNDEKMQVNIDWFRRLMTGRVYDTCSLRAGRETIIN